MFTNELTGDGIIVLDGHEIETVYYWLTINNEPGDLIAEGSISGSEDVMRKIKHAATVKLTLMDGPSLRLKCHGGKNGTRWVKALCN